MAVVTRTDWASEKSDPDAWNESIRKLTSHLWRQQAATNSFGNCGQFASATRGFAHAPAPFQTIYANSE
jgi:hypothetical protein